MTRQSAYWVVDISNIKSLHQKSIVSLNNLSVFCFVLHMHVWRTVECQCRGSASSLFFDQAEKCFQCKEYAIIICTGFKTCSSYCITWPLVASVCSPPHLQVVHNHSLKLIFGKWRSAHWPQHRQPHLQPAILTWGRNYDFNFTYVKLYPWSTLEHLD